MELEINIRHITGLGDLVLYDSWSSRCLGVDIRMSKIRPGEVYRHYKGNKYLVYTVATHTENQKSYVVYESLTDGRMWVRPLRMFTQSVTVNGKRVKRFEHVKEGRQN